MLENNLAGSYTAIAGIIVAIVAHFGFNVQITDVVTIIGGIVTLVGVVKQMVDHTNTVAQANAQIAQARRPQ